MTERGLPTASQVTVTFGAPISSNCSRSSLSGNPAECRGVGNIRLTGGFATTTARGLFKAIGSGISPPEWKLFLPLSSAKQLLIQIIYKSIFALCGEVPEPIASNSPRAVVVANFPPTPNRRGCLQDSPTPPYTLLGSPRGNSGNSFGIWGTPRSGVEFGVGVTLGGLSP